MHRATAGKKLLAAAAVAVGGSLFAVPAMATPTLQYAVGGDAGMATVVFIHGKSDCSSAMSDCNGYGSGTGPIGYWTNTANGANMLNEATLRYDSAGAHRYEAFDIGYDMVSQGFWSSANDVGACLDDLAYGTNNSGCNPNGYHRTSFHVVTHSAGATVMDRLLSTGWYGVNSFIIGNVVTLAPALAGSRASSALYGVDGYGGFCSSVASIFMGALFKNNGAQSLTRGAVIGEANKGYAGRSPRWMLKVTTTGGSYSANNDGAGTVSGGVTVREDDNDFNMGVLAGCLGYSSSDDMDGLLYWSDSDPTNNTGANGCNTNDTAYGGVNSCHNYGQFSGAYWHWFTSWGNHSHSRDDAYTSIGDWQGTGGCYFRSPGTCVGQYGLN